MEELVVLPGVHRKSHSDESGRTRPQVTQDNVSRQNHVKIIPVERPGYMGYIVKPWDGYGPGGIRGGCPWLLRPCLPLKFGSGTYKNTRHNFDLYFFVPPFKKKIKTASFEFPTTSPM